MITLVLGGARSGKSAWAERCALSLAARAEERCYLATGVACDEEMERRIKKHQERRCQLFYTIEEPYDLGKCLEGIKSPTKVVLIDCLTTWLGNLTYRDSLHYQSESGLARNIDDNIDCFPEIKKLGQALQRATFDVIMVSNELGWGIVPAEAETRLFRDRQGRLNQYIASLADQVIFTIAGLPLALKAPGEKRLSLENIRAI